MEEYQKKSRDNARTPMQWDVSPNAGFTSEKSKPWMSANPNFTEINAESQVNDAESPFSYWKTMLAVRKKYKDILVYGNFKVVDDTNEKVMAYKRQSEQGESILVLCNFSADKVEWNGERANTKDIVLSSYGRSLNEVESGSISLDPYEAIALLL
jgi:glycosidase